ncbi:hypothetical protein J4416_04130 [Candidatus Pacearchaeota archaeon]|nr:hypothetical protein [Candidatus Pacearchaeota archaeon]
MAKLINIRGQVTIFVIIAIVIVGIIVLFISFKGNLFGDNIPSSLAPVYARYDACISEEASNGINLLSSQGGRINVGELTRASDFSPFSSHLNFLGLKIPYWHGYSENNIVINNVPTVRDMESEIEDFVYERVNDCDFSDFIARGFIIEKSEADVSVTIEDNQVVVSVDAPLSVSFDEDSARKINHKANVNSKLGILYKDAVSINGYERGSLFLENYALDVLQSYAPVDGVEVQCSPKIWKTPEVVSEIKKSLSANIGAIGFSGGNKKDKYFTVNNNVKEPVNLMYLAEEFPSKIEITPASQALMIAEPVGTQEGMGIMGFCYVPYHFIYDLRFPVLVQIGDGLENFQFPVVVDIDNNVVGEPAYSEVAEDLDYDVCSFAENDVTVNTYDYQLNPVSANVSYHCFDSLCDIGETIVSRGTAELNAKIPVCVNGQLVATADGYADSKILFSSNSENFAEIILEKEYSLDVEIRLGGKVVRNSTAVVHFVGIDGYSANAIIPESSKVKLKEGMYNIKAFVYGNSNVVIPATTKTECYKANRGGIAGIFGSTKEVCVPVEIPATKIDYALRGGGKLEDYYILGSELENGKVIIDVSELPVPNSLEQLQYNYEVFETLGAQLDFA